MIEALFIAATSMELEQAWSASGNLINPWPDELAQAQHAGYSAPCCLVTAKGKTFLLREGDHEHLEASWAYAVTGVGIPLTVLRLSSLLARLNPKRVIQVGIGGAFSKALLAIGDVVCVTTEVFGDLGLEVPGSEVGFIPLSQTAFADAILSHEYVLQKLETIPQNQGFKVLYGKGITVNTVGGTELTLTLRSHLFNADVESMEGAAAALVCAAVKTPLVEIRSISNWVGPRDMQPSNIALALQNLKALLRFSHGNQWK